MDFDKFTDVISKEGGKLIHKGKAAKEIVSIKTEINSSKNALNQAYLQLGRMYYEMYSDGAYNPEFDKQMKAIKNARNAIKELEEKVSDVKSTF